MTIPQSPSPPDKLLRGAAGTAAAAKGTAAAGTAAAAAAADMQ